MNRIKFNNDLEVLTTKFLILQGESEKFSMGFVIEKLQNLEQELAIFIDKAIHDK